jgi:hypothetical protein
MKFGKHRDKEAPLGEAAAEAPPATDSATQAWPAPGDGEDHSMAPPDSSDASAPEPVVEAEPEAAAEAEPVFEGEAVELPYEPPVPEEPPPAPVAPAAAYQAPAYEPPSSHLVEPEPRVALVDSINPGSKGGAWPEPAFDLAERPEILVGAAFGGGLLLALILRRLGH